MNTVINFFLNGQKYKLYELINLNQLINYFGYKDNLFVLEYNNVICDQKSWNTTNIGYDDEIEIVTIVGGG